jgi:hypothetical protein
MIFLKYFEEKFLSPELPVIQSNHTAMPLIESAFAAPTAPRGDFSFASR